MLFYTIAENDGIDFLSAIWHIIVSNFQCFFPAQERICRLRGAFNGDKRKSGSHYDRDRDFWLKEKEMNIGKEL